MGHMPEAHIPVCL